jgi:hypothetical protein
MVKIVKETIAQESMSFFVSDHEKGISNFKESMFLEEAYKEASKSFQQNNPTEVETLLNPKATDEERQQALNVLNKEVANQLGITEDQVKLVLDDNPDNKYKGFTSAENNNMYIVKNNQDNAKDEASSAFNEFSDHYDIYNHLGVDNTDKTYKDNRDKYSELFGNIGADWLDFTYTSSGKNSLSTVVNENRYTNSYLVQTNTDEYSKLDKNQGAFRKATAEESQILQGLIKGKSSDETYRLIAAACALIHCANGVPEYDSNYELLQQLQKAGESLTEEQGIIRKEASTIALNEMMDEEGNIYDDVVPAGYFTYTPGDSATDLFTRHNEGAMRIEGLASTASGGVGILTGYAMASGGVATCGLTVGLSCASIPVGVVIASLSGNHMYGGYQTFIGDYAGSNEGAIVLNSLQPHTGDLSNPLWDFAFNAGVNAIGAVGGLSTLKTGIWGTISKADDVGMGISSGKVGVLEDANYAQTTYRNAFSDDGITKYTNLAGKPINTVDDLANAIKNNAVRVADIPVEYIVRDGKILILNTRTSQALEKAGIPKSQWKGIDKTGDADAEKRLTDQLLRNKLDSSGISTVRQTGVKSQ